MNKPLQSYIIVSALQFGTHCRIELMSFSHDSCTYDACLVAILTSTRLRLLSSSLVLCPHVGGYVSSLDSFFKLSEYCRLSVTSTTAFGILPKHLVYGRSSGNTIPNDWRANTSIITAATVDANRQSLIQMAQNGTFAAVCTPLSLMSVYAKSDLCWNNHAYTRTQQLYNGRSCQVLPTAQSGV